MTKAELAKEYGRSASTVHRAMHNLYGESAGIDLTDEMVKDIRAYFEERGGVKVHIHESENAIYHTIYDELVSNGFILVKDLKHRLGVKILGNFLSTMDDLNLWTYDDSVVVQETTDKGKIIDRKYLCIRACDPKWRSK